MSQQGWRTETDASDYFLHQQKQLQVADRRPVIRKASDLVGPGINSSAIRLEDFNDLLATFNGYYAAAPGADSAPNATEAFVGTVTSDAAYGGKQEFTGLTSGAEYIRTFTRSPEDPEAVAWGQWVRYQRVPPTAVGYSTVDTTMLSGEATTLKPPNLSTTGEAGVYERSDTGIKIRKAGIYTGHLRFGDRAGTTVLSNLSVFVPDGAGSRGDAHLGVPLGPTYYMPFTIVATDVSLGFYVAAEQTSGTPRDVWWQFACTRIGDAV